MDNTENFGDPELIAGVAQCQQSALECLYDRYGAAIHSLALRITADRGAAEEIAQDVFLQLWKKASSFDSAAGSLFGWLMAMARHRAISHVRRKSNEFYGGDSSEDDGIKLLSAVNVPGFSNSTDARALVSKAMDALSRVQREVLMFAYYEGMTAEEIALLTNTSLGTIKTRIRTALQAMRKFLSQQTTDRTSDKLMCQEPLLEDILITYELWSRPSRPKGWTRQSDCLRLLSEVAQKSTSQLLDCFLQMTMSICAAGSAGLSLLEVEKGEEIFRWTNLVGVLSRYVGGKTPRNFSPCGVTMDRQAPQLFSYPARYFQYFKEVDIPIVEGLVIPFHVGAKILGTVWIVSHRSELGFDAEHVRIMSTLSGFTGAALHRFS